MKYYTSLFIILIVSIDCIAGDSTCNNWLHGKHRHNGYGSFSVKYQTLGKNNYVNYGFCGAYRLSKHFALGGGGFGQLYAASLDQGNGNVYLEKLKFGYGGILPEFRSGMHRRVGMFANFLIGFGGFEALNYGGGFAIVEPHIMASIKLTPVVRIDIGGAYRKALGASDSPLLLKNISGFSILTQLKFGITQ